MTTKKQAKGTGGRAPSLAVRPDEKPWTTAEVAAVRTELEEDVERLQTELDLAESDLADLLREPVDGAGDDQADAGAKSYERDQEIDRTHATRASLRQGRHALQRLEAGTYGDCESCGEAIGKLRLQAFPRASLCLRCKAAEERR